MSATPSRRAGACLLALAAATASHALARPRIEALASCRAVIQVADERELEIEALLDRGRVQLQARDVPAALVLFERAAELDGHTFRTRLWVLRAWVGFGRINDALDAIDAYARQPDADRVALDYLYGMAFAYKAQGYLADKVEDPSVALHFAEAAQFLTAATEAAPARFPDAFLALALAAWHASPPDLARARLAIGKALAAFPNDQAAHFQLGRIAFSEFRATQPDERRRAEADSHWRTAFDAFGRSAELAAGRAPLVARAELQRAQLLLWTDRLDEAATAFTRVMAVDPAGLDYAEVHGQLGDERFVQALEQGAAAFAAGAGPDAAARTEDGLLLWWLGYGRFNLRRFEASEEAFQSCLGKRPDFVNSWFWIGHGRYERELYAEAIAAFRRNAEGDPAGLQNSMQRNLAYNLPVVRWLMDWAYKRGDLENATGMAEIGAEAALEDVALWSNLGLFLREQHDALVAAQRVPDEPELVELAERALAAYRRALALQPTDPLALNDTGVVLHYYVARDFDEAERLYRQAVTEAERLLSPAATRPLAPDLRPLYEQVLSDARANLDALAALRADGR